MFSPGLELIQKVMEFSEGLGKALEQQRMKPRAGSLLLGQTHESRRLQEMPELLATSCSG